MCLKRDLSYAIQLYVPGEYSYSVEQKQMNTESKAQDLYFHDRLNDIN
jgi:hypothetical protein